MADVFYADTIILDDGPGVPVFEELRHRYVGSIGHNDFKDLHSKLELMEFKFPSNGKKLLSRVPGGSRNAWQQDVTQDICELADISGMEFLYGAATVPCDWNFCLEMEQCGYLLDKSKIEKAISAIDSFVAWSKENIDTLCKYWRFAYCVSKDELIRDIVSAEVAETPIGDDGDNPRYLYSYFASVRQLLYGALRNDKEVLHVATLSRRRRLKDSYELVPAIAPILAENFSDSVDAEYPNFLFDYSEDSIRDLDLLIDSWRVGGFYLGQASDALFAVGCYFGEVFARQGTATCWAIPEQVTMDDHWEAPFVLVTSPGTYCSPIDQVTRRMKHGPDESLYDFYVRFAMTERGASNLGRPREKGDAVSQDAAQVIKVLRRKAEAGSAKAQYQLAMRYQDGDGVQQDNTQCVHWIRLAARSYGLAMYALANRYEHGTGVTQDLTEALRLYLLAAEHKVAAAYYNLGLMYRDGHCVERDAAKAIEWLKQARDADWSDANAALNAMPEGDFQRGKALLASCEEARRNTALAMPDAELIYSQAGEVYTASDPESMLLAFALYMHAAELGHSEAQLQVAFRYLRGLGVAQDSNRAVEWYLKSAKQGYDQSQIALAAIYESGNGVAKDADLARYWYSKAAAQGNFHAEFNLGLRDSPNPTRWELGITVTPVRPPSDDPMRDKFGEPIAEFYKSLDNAVILVVVLIGILLSIVSNSPIVVGSLLIASLAYLWIERSKYRVTLYDYALVQSGLWGTSSVALGPDTRYRNRKSLLTAAAGKYIAINDGNTLLKLSPRLTDANLLRRYLMAAEKRDFLTRAAYAYRKGNSLDFHVLRLQRGKLYAGRKSIAFTDVTRMMVDDVDRLIIYGRTSRFAFLKISLERIPNTFSLLRLLEAYTPAGFSSD